MITEVVLSVELYVGEELVNGDWKPSRKVRVKDLFFSHK